MSDPATVARQVAHLLDVRRYGEARRVLGGALRERPEDVDLLYLSALTESRAGEAAPAQRWVGEVLSRAPGHAGARALQVRLDLEARRFTHAERGVLGLLRERPEEGHLYALYAQVMLHTLHLDKARALVDEALRRSPGDALASVLDVLLHLVQGRDAAAAQRLEALVAADPEAEHVASLLLTVLHAQHRYPEALAVGRALLRTRPDDAGLVDALVGLRMASHWTMWPLRPLLRYGWAGSGALWALNLALVALLRRVAPRLALAVGLVFLVWVVYSWVYPPLLRRWLRWRGF